MFDVGAVVGRLEMSIQGWKDSVETVKKDQQSLSGLVLRHSDKIKSLGKTFTLAGGAMVGSLGLLLKKTVDYGDNLNDLSQRVGIGADTLSTYGLAAEKSGTSLEGLATGFRGLARNMNDANTGSKESQRTFKMLGIAWADSEGKLRPLNDVLLDVADRFARMPEGPQKTALAMELFGRSGMELIPILNMGRQGLEENAEAARRLGIVWSQEAAKKADEFNDSMAELKAGIAGTGRELISALLPAVKSGIDGIRDIVVKVREWVAEHPTLTGWIVKTAGGVGILMTALGPFLFALPNIVRGIQTIRGMHIGDKLIGQFKGLSGNVTGVSSLLGRLPAIGAAAFAGWNIGKLIGEITGADKAIEGIFSGLIDKAGLYKGKAEEADLTTERLAKRQLFLAEASRISGREITSLNEAMDIIRGTFEKSGTTGNAVLDDWAKKSSTAQKAVDEHRKKVGDFIPILDEVAKKQKTWGEYLQDYGVVPLKEKREQIAQLLDHEERLNLMLAQGAIDSQEYGDGIKSINDKLKELGSTTETLVLPPARDLGNLWEKVPGLANDTAYSIGTLEDQLKDYADQQGYSTLTAKVFIYELQRLQLAAAGIHLPELPWSTIPKEAQTATETTQNHFDGLYNNIALGFGEVVSSIKISNDGLEIDFKQLFSTVLDAFKTMIGEMVADWVLGKFKDLFSSIGNAATNTMSSAAQGAAQAVGGITQGASQAIGGMWTALGSAVGSFLGTTLAGLLGGGPSGHAQQQQINDIKDMRNYLAELNNFVWGTAKPWFGTTDKALGDYFGKFDGLKGSVDLTRSTLHGDLAGIIKALSSTTSAQHGAVIRGTELVRVHGTRSRPEYILPEPDLRRMIAQPKVERGDGKPAIVNIRTDVHINGQMITTRDFTRQQIMEEFELAIRAGIRKAGIQSALGLR